MGATPHKAVTNRFPQVGGNRTSEAPGAVFDPTPGDEGVETPPPNDSLKASLIPPVGGRLRSFRRDWQRNKCSSNVLNIITNGCVLPFLSKPSLVRFPLIQSEYKAHQKDQALATCIKSLLSKNAIERVENVKSLWFYSRLFLVPRPHQRWRPVIDLSRLSTFLHVEKFKMETPESIRTSLIPGEWVSSIDLSDAYLHIPIHPHSRKYLRFCYRSHMFQFTSFPFGQVTAPQVFTMIVKELKLMALSRGLRLHQYLDNWLIRSQSQEEAQVNTQAVVDLTQSLGWIINQEKSELKPMGVFVRGLRIPSRFSACKTHLREMAQTSGYDPTTQVKTCCDCKMFDAANWVVCLNGENGPGGTPSLEALFEKWCRENLVDFSTPSVKQISDFFMYLYQDQNRRPLPLMVTGWPLLTLWAQRATILHKVQTFTGYSPVFTGIIQKVPGIFQNGTFQLFSMSSQMHLLSL